MIINLDAVFILHCNCKEALRLMRGWLNLFYLALCSRSYRSISWSKWDKRPGRQQNKVLSYSLTLYYKSNFFLTINPFVNKPQIESDLLKRLVITWHHSDTWVETSEPNQHKTGNTVFHVCSSNTSSLFWFA